MTAIERQLIIGSLLPRNIGGNDEGFGGKMSVTVNGVADFQTSRYVGRNVRVNDD